jgi:Zn-finger nucleic acid-binding protein
MVKITIKSIGEHFTLQVHQAKVIQKGESECCSWRCLGCWLQADLQQLMVNREMTITAATLNSEKMNTRQVDNDYERISIGIIALIPV